MATPQLYRPVVELLEDRRLLSGASLLGPGSLAPAGEHEALFAQSHAAPGRFGDSAEFDRFAALPGSFAGAQEFGGRFAPDRAFVQARPGLESGFFAGERGDFGADDGRPGSFGRVESFVLSFGRGEQQVIFVERLARPIEVQVVEVEVVVESFPPPAAPVSARAESGPALDGSGEGQQPLVKTPVEAVATEPAASPARLVEGQPGLTHPDAAAFRASASAGQNQVTVNVPGAQSGIPGPGPNVAADRLHSADGAAILPGNRGHDVAAATGRVDTPGTGEAVVAKPRPVPSLKRALEGPAAEETDRSAPQMAGPFTGGLPFDWSAVENNIADFFSRVEDLGTGGPGGHVHPLVGSALLAAAAALAAEFARRHWHASAPAAAGAGTEQRPDWLPPSDR